MASCVNVNVKRLELTQECESKRYKSTKIIINNNYCFSDVRKTKDMRKQFEKISDDLDNALVRNSSAQKSKPLECKEATNDLAHMKSCFAHTSLDYVFEVSVSNNFIHLK
jgi:ribosomal protein L4